MTAARRRRTVFDPRDQLGERPWRIGRSVGRTVYDARDRLIGVLDTPALARCVVMAVNAGAEDPRALPPRPRYPARARASLELRAWQTSGASHDLGPRAWQALCGAAHRLGFRTVREASLAGCSVDLYSEAIEEVESE